jgi:hypothetical protein
MKVSKGYAENLGRIKRSMEIVRATHVDRP